MIYVFYGSDRKKISLAVRTILGDDYEVYDGENIAISDIPNLMMGNSLFADQRKILIKDLTGRQNAEAVNDGSSSNNVSDYYDILQQYLDTPHEIVIWETNVSRKKSFKDFLANSKVKSRKYDLPPQVDMRKVFGIYDTALTNGVRAIKMLEEIKSEEDPYMFVGLLASQAIKNYARHQGRKEKRALKELSKLDIDLKSTKYDPWLLISTFILKLQSF